MVCLRETSTNQMFMYPVVDPVLFSHLYSETVSSLIQYSCLGLFSTSLTRRSLNSSEVVDSVEYGLQHSQGRRLYTTASFALLRQLAASFCTGYPIRRCLDTLDCS